MKRIIGLALLIIVLLCSCSGRVARTDEAAHEKKGYDSNRSVLYSAKGHFNNGAETDPVVVFSEKTDDEYNTQKLILEVDINDKAFYCEIGEFPSAIFRDGVLILADFDENGSDEVFISTSVNPNMVRVNRIYRLAPTGWELLQDLDEYDPEFIFEFKENRSITLSNKDGTISMDVDISHFSDEAFDSDGKYNIGYDMSLIYGNLFSCELTDDNKISAVGSIKDSYMNRWGLFRYTFEYDKDLSQMHIIDTEYVGS